MFTEAGNLEILSYLLAVLIGFVLGLIGAGGTILSVPVLVYLLRFRPEDAISHYSVFTVAVSSWISSWRYLRLGHISLKTAVWFIPTGISGFLITKKLILPAIPQTVGHLGSVTIGKDGLLMILFACFMLVAATLMIRSGKREITEVQGGSLNPLPLSAIGLFTGMLTGMFGTGGGFIIVPALTILGKTPIRQAIGTSLLIIAINTTSAFILNRFADPIELNWPFMILFTALTVIGSLLGILATAKIHGKKLKTAFGWFVLLMGIYIVLKELFLK